MRKFRYWHQVRLVILWYAPHRGVLHPRTGPRTFRFRRSDHPICNIASFAVRDVRRFPAPTGPSPFLGRSMSRTSWPLVMGRRYLGLWWWW